MKNWRKLITREFFYQLEEAYYQLEKTYYQLEKTYKVETDNVIQLLKLLRENKS